MRRKNRWKRAAAGMVTLCLLLSACQTAEKTEDDEGKRKTTVDIKPTEDINEVGMIEDKSVYEKDDPDSMVYFYVTVQKGDEGSKTDHTFAEVNSVVRFVNDAHVAEDVYAKAIVQVGDETGPLPGMLGYGLEKSNAKIRIRGNSSTVKPQKSYKLDLDKEAGLWRGQSNIALNKHVFDVTKMKNKLYFDLLKKVEDVPSIRTQFARLFIKDETSGKTQFEDYGLYTQAEVPSKKYLTNHGLDKEGYLYKAIAFNFEPNDGLKNFDDPEFSQEKFETVLSCKGKQDNTKLIDLVEKINDLSIDINDIVGTYIDRDNYVTWLAYNILTANIDTTVQNFYLYSPTNSQKWFFIPWDGDNMLHTREDIMEGQNLSYGGWEKGISNYWGVILHQRFLKNEDNRKELEAKMDELHESISKESVETLVEQYNKTIEPYVLSMPDFYYLGHTKEERDTIVSGLGDEIEESYTAFKDTLDDVMPFFLQGIRMDGNEQQILWDTAYDFKNQEITYELTVSRTPDMSVPVIKETKLKEAFYKYSQQQLPAGTYYYTVKAVSADGRTAMPMNKIQVNDVYYPGVDILEVK